MFPVHTGKKRKRLLLGKRKPSKSSREGTRPRGTGGKYRRHSKGSR